MIKRKITDFHMDFRGRTGISCAVPCSLCSVLAKNGFIPDPFRGDNAARLPSVYDTYCTFTSRFSLPLGTCVHQNQLLRLRGVGGKCTVLLNGVRLGSTANINEVYSFDIGGTAVDGDNTLVLEFAAPESVGVGGVGFGASLAPFCDVGVFRDVEIVAFDHKMIDSVQVKQRHTEGAVELELVLNTVGDDDMSRAVATLVSPAGNVYYCGFAGGNGIITVREPNLWWPNGLGPQNLYKLSVNLYSESEIEDSLEMRIGLRTITKAEDGATLCINGVSYLSMGAIYDHESGVLFAYSKDKMRKLLADAKRAGINTLCLNDGDSLPPHGFYDLCDEMGFVVWQGMPMGMCIDTSVGELIKLGAHASLGVLLGERARGADMLTDAFADVVHIRSLDAAQMRIVGCGRDALPPYATLTNMMREDDMNLFSPAMECHMSDGDAAVRMLGNISSSNRFPQTTGELCYASELATAQLTRAEIEGIRRRRGEICGVVFDRLNDTRPAVSTASVDYDGRWKALHYMAKRFYAPITVSAENDGTRVKFYISNESKNAFDGNFTYSVVSMDNTAIFKDRFNISVDPMSVAQIFTCDLTSLVSGRENEFVLAYSVDGGAESCGMLSFVDLKRLALVRPRFDAGIVGAGTSFTLTLSSDALALGVYIDFVGVDVAVEDNFFDITESAPRRISLSTPSITTASELSERMRICSAFDIGR